MTFLSHFNVIVCMFVCIEVSDTYILVNSYIILIITLEKHADSKYLAQKG